MHASSFSPPPSSYIWLVDNNVTAMPEMARALAKCDEFAVFDWCLQSEPAANEISIAFVGDLEEKSEESKITNANIR